MKTYRIQVQAKAGDGSLVYFTEQATSPKAAIRSVKNCVRQLTEFHACDYTYAAKEVTDE